MKSAAQFYSWNSGRVCWSVAAGFAGMLWSGLVRMQPGFVRSVVGNKKVAGLCSSEFG